MKFIAGVDEVGRGSLIGPVYAAAVILNKSINKKLLKDSKRLTKSKRETLSKYIKKNSIFSTFFCDNFATYCYNLIFLINKITQFYEMMLINHH